MGHWGEVGSGVVGGENWALGGGRRRWRRKWGNANQMLAQGTVKKNRLSREPGAGLPLGRAGRAGTDVWRKERRKKRSRKKNWNEMHSLGAGPFSRSLRLGFSCVKTCS